jgi:effector-binding domain-containing protein
MLKIGLFSQISRVPVKTLRYYDEIGLLEPAEVDRFTGYRYYDVSQLPRLHRIMALKDLGLSLDQISNLIKDSLTPEQLRGMLRLKQAEIRQRIEEEQERLARLETRLQQIEMENHMSTYDVIVKSVEAQTIASVRSTIPAYPAQGHLWQELGTVLGRFQIKPSGACFTLYHSEEPDIDAEVCEPVEARTRLPDHPRVKYRELPAAKVASVIHHGPFETIGQAYEALVRWIETNGYQINGPSREIYLQPAQITPEGECDASQIDPNTVTEIQFPIEKK